MIKSRFKVRVGRMFIIIEVNIKIENTRVAIDFNYLGRFTRTE